VVGWVFCWWLKSPKLLVGLGTVQGPSLTGDGALRVGFARMARTAGEEKEEWESREGVSGPQDLTSE
jgi:hypothetical protein